MICFNPIIIFLVCFSRFERRFPDQNPGLFTIYKKIAINPVGKLMEHDFFGRSSGKFPGRMEHLKR